ncbi:hypothetical protein GC093_33940 [Paenibacillus sp. LMG 31456]|uniref:Uncharacterized protein n=1 Tax=Paenibacillus foliorum TaxID=2654974 RepID=A0A972K6J2_9BACL|nr:hypothetical protein [Paenibacillus foliorum]NOU98197.1 hypothetical protein [Paenibacillus foliorum]
MGEQLQSFIQDLMERNKGVFKEGDFKDCQGAAADIREMIRRLESTEINFRRKLSEISAKQPPDKEKIIYLQGLVDGMNLAIKPMEIQYDNERKTTQGYRSEE